LIPGAKGSAAIGDELLEEMPKLSFDAMNPIPRTLASLLLALFLPLTSAAVELPEASTPPPVDGMGSSDTAGTPHAASIAPENAAPETEGDAADVVNEEKTDRVRGVAHAPDPEKDRFHFTSLRTWYFHDFLPKSDDADTLGIEVNSAWAWGEVQLTNISYFEIADYARAVPGKPYGNPEPELGSATGITDLLSAFLLSRKGVHHDHHHWSLGLATQLPTASDDTIGSGKWSLGPAVEYEYENGPFFAAFVALQLWSVVGDSDREDVNMLMIKPMITYDVFEQWKLVYMPYGISAYWNKKPGQKFYVPVGGGVQHGFSIFTQEMAASVQFFKYVVRPDKGSEYDLRFMLEFDF